MKNPIRFIKYKFSTHNSGEVEHRYKYRKIAFYLFLLFCIIFIVNIFLRRERKVSVYIHTTDQRKDEQIIFFDNDGNGKSYLNKALIDGVKAGVYPIIIYRKSDGRYSYADTFICVQDTSKEFFVYINTDRKRTLLKNKEYRHKECEKPISPKSDIEAYLYGEPGDSIRINFKCLDCGKGLGKDKAKIIVSYSGAVLKVWKIRTKKAINREYVFVCKKYKGMYRVSIVNENIFTSRNYHLSLTRLGTERLLNHFTGSLVILPGNSVKYTLSGRPDEIFEMLFLGWSQDTQNVPVTISVGDPESLFFVKNDTLGKFRMRKYECVIPSSWKKENTIRNSNIYIKNLSGNTALYLTYYFLNKKGNPILLEESQRKNTKDSDKPKTPIYEDWITLIQFIILIASYLLADGASRIKRVLKRIINIL